MTGTERPQPPSWRDVGGGLRDALWAAPGVLPPIKGSSVGRRWRRFGIGIWVFVAFVLYVGAAGQLETWDQPVFVALGLSTVQVAPVAVALRAPLAAWRLQVAGLALAGALDAGLGPVTGLIAFIVTLFAVGLRCGRSASVGVGIVSVVAMIPGLATGMVSLREIGVSVPVVVGVLVVGRALAGQRELATELGRSEEGRRTEQARTAVLEEKSRIARELHDVVAHHMSMVAIQAEAAPHRLEGLSPEAKQTFVAIRSAAREALAEMRRIIGVLRQDEAELSPQPGLSELEELVASARSSGAPVELTTIGEPSSLPTGVDLSAYRIVQEALSNARRHAAGAPVEVDLWFSRTSLRIRIVNGPSPWNALGDKPAASGASAETLGSGVDVEGRLDTDSDPGAAAHGLTGMRERVAMLGGELHAGPRGDGGFVVEALLPLDPQEEDDGANATDGNGEGGAA